MRIYVGSLPTASDSFSVLRGSTNLFDVMSNDVARPEYTTPYTDALNAVSGATHGASLGIVDSFVWYIPDAAYNGTYPYTETFHYELKDNSDRFTTGLVSVVVYDMADSQASSIVYVINTNDVGSTVNILCASNGTAIISRSSKSPPAMRMVVPILTMTG